MVETATITLAFILDLVIGDPKQFPHPVRGMGWAITKLERFLRKTTQDRDSKMRNSEKLAGILLVVIIAGATYGIFYLAGEILLRSHSTIFISYVFLLVFVYLVSTTLSTRELVRAGQAVVDEVIDGNMEDARKKLSMIVGRDTASLDIKGVLRATIETMSENASDGIIAPLFYFAIGGLPLAMTYKAINTLDSMVGYRNEKYRNFGWAAAKLDDIVNYIPARITGTLIVIAALVISIFKYIVFENSKWFKMVRNSSSLNCVEHFNKGEKIQNGLRFNSSINAFKVMVRDGMKHSSPNSGIPEAAMAGALGVRLGGPSTYDGVKIEKPYIGEGNLEQRIHNKGYRRQSPSEYLKASEAAVSVTKVTSFLGLLFTLAILYLRNS